MTELELFIPALPKALLGGMLFAAVVLGLVILTDWLRMRNLKNPKK